MTGRQRDWRIHHLRNKINQCKNMIEANYFASRAQEELDDAKRELNRLEWERAYAIAEAFDPIR